MTVISSQEQSEQKVEETGEYTQSMSEDEAIDVDQWPLIRGTTVDYNLTTTVDGTLDFIRNTCSQVHQTCKIRNFYVLLIYTVFKNKNTKQQSSKKQEYYRHYGQRLAMKRTNNWITGLFLNKDSLNLIRA